jgi:hypothetical protein
MAGSSLADPVSLYANHLHATNIMPDAGAHPAGLWRCD